MWAILLTVGAVYAGMLTGCTPFHTRALPASDLTDAGGDEPMFFSDASSLTQAAKSQKLLLLQKEEYRVGPDDVLEISVFEWETNDETKTLALRVSEAGVIAVPTIGALEVAGQSVQNIQRTIETALVEKGVLQNPRVGVLVSEFRSRKISVLGAVNQPGSYAIHQNVSTLLEMLSLAGGPQDGAGGLAYVIRGGGTGARIKIDLDELLQRGSARLNPVLIPGDVIYVPKAPLIYVYGAVKQAGAFTFRKQLRVLEAIALAGGFGDMASRGDVTLIRHTDDAGEQAYTLDVGRIETGEDPNIFLRDGDVLHVRRSTMKTVGYEFYTFLRGIFTFTYRLDGSN